MYHKIVYIIIQCLVFQVHRKFVQSAALYGINVRRAVQGEFLNVVCILRQHNPLHDLREDIQCTGTMITRDHILTSQHCFNNMGTHALYVLGGTVDLRQSTPFYIWWWITYELWANFHKIEIDGDTNDIAVIKLLEKLPYTISPALISSESRSNLYGADVFIAGWGKILNNSLPYILNKAKVTIISNEDCEMVCIRAAGTSIPIDQRYICTHADPPSHIYNGDSGGPVFFGSHIVAINHGTIPESIDIGDVRRVNIHFTVDFYRRFIQDNMCI